MSDDDRPAPESVKAAHTFMGEHLLAFWAGLDDATADAVARDLADGKISLVVNRDVVNVAARTVLPPGQGLS